MIQLSQGSIERLAHCRYECNKGKQCEGCKSAPSSSEIYILNNSMEALRQVHDYQVKKVLAEQ